MNTVAMTGRITQDLNLKKTENSQYVRFRLAVDKRFKRGETDFFTVTVWGNPAERVCKYGCKGQLVSVAGRLEAVEYTDKNGVDKRDVQIIADDVGFLEYKQKETAQPIPENVPARTPVEEMAHEIAQYPDISEINTDELADLDLPFEF